MAVREAVQPEELEPQLRSHDFSEVVGGYTPEQAMEEASRCLQCKNPVCIAGCPVGIDIKAFISQIRQEDYTGAYFTIRQKNNFPSLCGRVCPAEYQCRKACVLTKRGQPFASPQAVNIHFLERFIGDYGITHRLETPGVALRDKRVAVVGSGPAGLCCAGELAREGIKVVIFEALHAAGGVLRYGIPPFRLPREILDLEINYLKKLGVEIVLNSIIGKSKSLQELFNVGYSAVFLGLGAGVPAFLGVKGESLGNVYSANEFLTRVNLMSAYDFPRWHTPVSVGRHMVIIGGGNTALDAARSALRLQRIHNLPLDTTILYRRTEVEMPARRLEIEHARQEGVKLRFLVQPTGFSGNEEALAEKVTCLECRLGKEDSSGRRSPVPIEGSDFTLACDVAVVAIGLKANQVLTKATPELKVDRYADVVVDPQSMETSLEGVFAGGDIVGGEGTVIEAMGMAKRAAASIIKRLRFG